MNALIQFNLLAFALAAFGLLAAAMVACWLPARKAIRVSASRHYGQSNLSR